MPYPFNTLPYPFNGPSIFSQQTRAPGLYNSYDEYVPLNIPHKVPPKRTSWFNLQDDKEWAEIADKYERRGGSRTRRRKPKSQKRRKPKSHRRRKPY